MDNSQEFLFASNSFYEWLSTLHIPTRVETRPQGIGDCFSSEPFEEEYKSNKLELLECQARILICHDDKIAFPNSEALYVYSINQNWSLRLKSDELELSLA